MVTNGTETLADDRYEHAHANEDDHENEQRERDRTEKRMSSD